MQRVIVADSDRVMGGMLIPPGGKLNGVHIALHQISEAAESVLTEHNIMVTGYVFPVHEPETAQNYGDIWDKQVPKDVSVSIVAASAELDMDEDTADVAPEYEIGLLDPTKILKLGSTPQKFFQRKDELTFANTPKGDTTATWFVTNTFKSQVKKQISSRVAAVALVGVSIPAMTETTQTEPATLGSAAEWMELTYLGDTVLDAMKMLTGRTETGAETPYAGALTMLKRVLEPGPFEQNAGAFQGAGEYSMRTFCSCTWDISVPGELRVPRLTGE